MGTARWTAPEGCDLEGFDSIGSTNTEALRRCRERFDAGEFRPLWVAAQEQTSGRGRHGRSWNSPRGNLYATRIIGPLDGPAAGTTLPFVAALAVFDTIAGYLPGDTALALQLKWPNDVLIDARKISGILGESEWHGSGTHVAMGIGINLVETPSDRATAALAEFSVRPTPQDVFGRLSRAFEGWLARWDDGRRFETIRRSWLERAGRVGTPATVRLGAERVEGCFAGLDPHGALLLKTSGGAVRRISAGEVMMAGEGA